jgi:ornithine cyclodeaminase
MLLLGGEDVRRLLDVDALVDGLAAAFIKLTEGDVAMPPRSDVPSDGGHLYLMGAHVGGSRTSTVKLVTQFAGKAEGPLHHAIVVLFDAATGAPLALVDGEAITEIRTAAVSRLATRLLARRDASTLAVIGAGVQGAAHARALARDRTFADICVVDRDHARAQALARALDEELGVPVHVGRDVESALAGAEIVCAATGAVAPIVLREMLRDGAHVNSVGHNLTGREIDGATVRDAVVVVEERASALTAGAAGSPDLLMALDEHDLGADHVHAELGELLLGKKPGRTDSSQITLFKSVGLGMEDAVAASLVYESASRQQQGRQIEL